MLTPCYIRDLTRTFQPLVRLRNGSVHFSSSVLDISLSRGLFTLAARASLIKRKNDFMPRFEFEISVVLVICVLVSRVVWWFTMREKEGGVRLPVHIGEEESGSGMLTSSVDTGGYLSRGDPFDITKLEDIVDGYPIDEDGFWKRASR